MIAFANRRRPKDTDQMESARYRGPIVLLNGSRLAVAIYRRVAGLKAEAAAMCPRAAANMASLPSQQN
jgi:hypothetical protein